jgi:hypothetical protein
LLDLSAGGGEGCGALRIRVRRRSPQNFVPRGGDFGGFRLGGLALRDSLPLRPSASSKSLAAAARRSSMIAITGRNRNRLRIQMRMRTLTVCKASVCQSIRIVGGPI